MINKMLKTISIFVIAVMLLTSVTAVFADGEPLVDLSLVLPSTVSNHGAGVGESFKVGINFSFGDDLIGRGGIYVFGMDIKFDPNILEPIDPNTLEPVVGEITEGSYAYFADHIAGTPPTVNLNSAGDKFTILFGDTSYASITDAGEVLQLAFKVNPELEVKESLDTYIRVLEPTIFGRDITTDEAGEITDVKSYECIVNTADKLLKIRPPFRMPSLSAQKQGSTLTIREMSSVGPDSYEPLMATITDSDGNVLAEQEATVTAVRYNVAFELDEEIFEPGRYTLTLTHGLTSASKSFEIVAKDEPLPEPEPENPDTEPDTETGTDKETDGSDENTEDSDKDNSGSTESDSSTGGKPNGSTAGSIGGKNDTSTDKTDSDEKADNKTETLAPVKDPNVVYPNDIASHWAKSSIEYVYDYKLMNGYEDGSFAPDNSITRGEFATVMVRFLGLAENPDAAAKFADTEGHWAKGYIGALAASRIVDGVSETEFEPDSNITREQIAVILDRAFDLPPEDNKGAFFDDPVISIWAYDAVYDVLAAGYMQGDTTGNFNPQANATRAEVATIIQRLHSSGN